MSPSSRQPVVTGSFVRFVLGRLVGHALGAVLLALILLTMFFAVLWRAGYFQFMESADLDATFTPTIDTGIFGRVTLREGNCAPVVGLDFKRCRISHPSRRIMVREVATIGHMGRPLEPTLLVDAPALVDSTTSDEHGFFEVALAAGTYSVFVENDGREYCDHFDEQGQACPITVGAGRAEVDLLVNLAAD